MRGIPLIPGNPRGSKGVHRDAGARGGSREAALPPALPVVSSVVPSHLRPSVTPGSSALPVGLASHSPL